MLGMKTYPKDYVKECRAKVDRDVKAFRQLGKSRHPDAETRFFNNMVLVLDYMFVHRLTGIEGKDGNPLNEVRVLCNSLLLNQGKLQVEKRPGWPMSAPSGIQLVPEKSLLKYKAGDEIKLNDADFGRLSKAFFAELEKKYV